MATFNGFPNLPGEIRNMIWSFAIRDDRPGVQIFRSKSCARASESKDIGTTSSKPSKPLLSFRTIEEGDSGRKNVSTYLADAGLWMACKESRAIIKSYFRIPKWTTSPDGDWSSYEIRNCSVGLTGGDWSTRALKLRVNPAGREKTALFDEKSLRLSPPDFFWGSPLPQLTTFPDRDLFVLQARSTRHFTWNCLSFDFGFGPCTLRPCGGLKNIGFEFKTHWWDKENEDWKPHVIRMLADASSQRRCNPVGRLWIVDHRLKRNKDTPTIEAMATEAKFQYCVFYARDRKLVEVNDGNVEHFTAYYPQASDKEGKPLWSSSVDLAWRLYETYGSPVSVLACDDLDS